MTLYDRFRELLDQEITVALATVIAGPDGIGNKLLILGDGRTEGYMVSSEIAAKVAADAVDLLRRRESTIRSYAMHGGQYEVFIDAFPAPPQLIIVGAVQTAIPLSSFAKILGFRVIITDARGAFAQAERFPNADRVIKGWPQDVLPGLRLDAETYLVLLSHDPKFDEPTLHGVLPSPVRYIGAIGSRKTQRERFERLRNEGFSDQQLGRIYGPVGLDLGGRGAEETALAIIAEIVAFRYGKLEGREPLSMSSRYPHPTRTSAE